jgi:hypothetical protein
MLINVSIMILLKCVTLLIEYMMPIKACLLIQYDKTRKIIIEVITSQDADSTAVYKIRIAFHFRKWMMVNLSC